MKEFFIKKEKNVVVKNRYDYRNDVFRMFLEKIGYYEPVCKYMNNEHIFVQV